MDSDAAIRALIVAYAERLDAGDFDGVAALFEHGAFRSARDGSVREGPGAVRRMYDSVIVYDDGTPRTKHVLGNVVVDVDERAGTAAARCTFTVMQAEPGAPLRAVLSGRYVDRFERDDRAPGGWRFSERTVHPDLMGDLTRHMAR
ncbi:MAG: nuclear transport factor 2 family protein [Acidimicrobiia bacterium]